MDALLSWKQAGYRHARLLFAPVALKLAAVSVEGSIVLVVPFGEVAEDEVRVRFGRIVVVTWALFQFVFVVCDELADELTLYAGGALESPREAHYAFCEDLLDEGLGGQLVEEPYVDPGSNDPYAFVDTVVQEDSYFVLGDNRIRSSDSREFGQVPHEYLRGKVRARLWPIDRASVFQ